MQNFHSKLLNKSPNIREAFTTKNDGNLAFHVGDNEENVLHNHKVLAEKLFYKRDKLVHMKQIHSNIVKIVDESDDFFHPPTCDALITDKKEVPLMVMVADCSPLLFYDPFQEVIAVAHAGRAGAFNNIIHNVIETFRENFHSNLKDIIVSVGPAISQECYEVGEEIYKEAQELELSYAIKKSEDKFYLDIRKILKKQLLAENILEKNIEISDICSKCNENFFSYRENSKSGRFCGILYLKK
jgi:hypothetical protein